MSHDSAHLQKMEWRYTWVSIGVGKHWRYTWSPLSCTSINTGWWHSWGNWLPIPRKPRYFILIDRFMYMVLWVHYMCYYVFIYRSCQLMTQMLSFCHLWSSSSLASWRRCVCLVVTAGWLRVSTNSAHFEVWKPYCCYEWKHTNVYIQTLQDYHGNCLACWVHCWDTFSFRPSSIATTSHP